MKQTLGEIFLKYGHFGSDIGCADKGSTHSYIEPYSLLFDRFRDGCTIMEIGIAKGDSVSLWNEYFSNSVIVGVDLSIIFEPIKPMNKNKIRTIAADGTKPELLDALGTQTFDIIIDDGSHMTQDQITTFHLLKDRMNKGGVYIIEDLLALDKERHRYLQLHPSAEIIDLRKVKGRFDDALVVIKF